ncbi:hypothetical protein L4X63_20385 [Geomonas sp. Red32]|uniref:hypothetical protein n=1 Tax=Geomonas sp. Red32 TaxID=2912856 RepID=UPI00202CB612|nr:hypothetical protein [Geomonas sp. Red32]MCM0083944.1 hypothetical protein [Geomonas sp. Red32]
MKKRAFTCGSCGHLNIPLAADHFRGFAYCLTCGSLEEVDPPKHVRTARTLYREFAKKTGLPVSTLFELQKRGVLPRDLADCTPEHRAAAGAIQLALGSEDILRAALARLPKARREALVHPVPSDGLLTKWQRHVLDSYMLQYQHEQDFNAPRPGEKGKGYGSSVSTVADMILHLEGKFGLPADITRAEVKRLKKVAYNRVRRGQGQTAEGGGRV